MLQFSIVREILKDSKEAEILLAFLLKRPREYVFSHPELKITKTVAEKFKVLCHKRANSVPIAYLTHHKDFFGLDFYVDERVLIPRPETELLVEETLRILHTQYPIPNTHYSLCDLGTGSGCIAISLAKSLPNAKIVAVDISSGAIQVAKKNAKIHNVSGKITFKKSDLFSEVLDMKFDAIVANLPYIGKSEQSLVCKETLHFEPKQALFSGKTGLEIFERLFKQIRAMKYKPKFLICEMGFMQKKPLKILIKKYFGNAQVMWKNDLVGLPRVFILNPDVRKTPKT